MDSEIHSAALSLNLMTLWILKDKGLVTEAEIQERLRQTRAMVAAHYGAGPGVELIESIMKMIATGKPDNVAGFPAS